MASSQMGWQGIAISVLCSAVLTTVLLLLLYSRLAAANDAVNQHIQEMTGRVTKLDQSMEQLKAPPPLPTKEEKARVKKMIVTELTSEAMQKRTKKVIHDELTRPIANMINNWLPQTQNVQGSMQTNGLASIPYLPSSPNINTSTSQNYISSIVQRELAATLPSVITWDRCLRTLNPILAEVEQLVDQIGKVKSLSQHATAVDALRIVQHNLLSSIQTYQAKLGGLDNLLEHINKAKASGEAIRSILKAASEAKKNLDNMLNEVEAKQAELIEREEQQNIGASSLASALRAVSDSNNQARLDANGVLKAYFSVRDIEAELKIILDDARYEQGEINRILEEIREGRYEG